MDKDKKIILLCVILAVIVFFSCNLLVYHYKNSRDSQIEERTFSVSAITKLSKRLDIYTHDGEMYGVEWDDLSIITDVESIKEAYVKVPFIKNKPYIYTENCTYHCVRWAELHIPQDIWNSQSVPARECLGTSIVLFMILLGVTVNCLKNTKR